MQNTEICKFVKNENFHWIFLGVYLFFFFFFCSKHRLWVPVLTSTHNLSEAVLTGTHNLCFGAKIRKIGIPLHTPVLLYKGGIQGGIHVIDMFS